EHPLPSESRHHEDTGQASEQQPDREQKLVAEGKSATPVRGSKLADVGGHDRNFAAETDALYEAHRLQGPQVPGERASETHDREQDQGVDGAGNTSDRFCEPAEQDRADDLADVTDGDELTDVGRLEFPEADQHR